MMQIVYPFEGDDGEMPLAQYLLSKHPEIEAFIAGTYGAPDIETVATGFDIDYRTCGAAYYWEACIVTESGGLRVIYEVDPTQETALAVFLKQILAPAFPSGPEAVVDDAMSCDVFNDGEFPISIRAEGRPPCTI